MNNKEVKYLVNWTGKDICNDLNIIDDKHRILYLERLENILINGFWLTKEECVYNIANGFDKLKLELNSRLCFTELRLTMSHEHIKRYGLMGFGFDRSFVIERKGLPIKYTIDGINDEYLAIIVNLLLHFKNIKDDDNYNQVLFLLSNMKPIIDADTKMNNSIENEWRIIYTNNNEKYIRKSNENYPLSLLPFNHNELKLLILPDNKTKEMFFSRDFLKEWFIKSKQLLTLLTYEDVISF